VAKVWPKHAGEGSFYDALRDSQLLKLTCGVDGCEAAWEGRFDAVMEARNAHRAEEHPGLRVTRRRRQGRKIIVEEVPAPK
jgi:hypothetical protein